MWNRKETPLALFELILAGMHIPPFVDYADMKVEGLKYALKILTLLSFLKVYFVIETTTLSSPINSQKGKFIGYSYSSYI